ncbi:nickel-dependent hydrogenase large subunit [Sulfurimonas sp. HSL3-7]|uniref:nickel-dependent hydrogenase large subunit n=1 Tax=Sulfonitrofixus jiaomeiensis TaxID=3131938 RepID=UPI0031F73C5F
MTKQLIDQIEGEASIRFDMKENMVDFATIAFPHFRGMEAILEGKPALDALVVTPRVCGICGHAHLMASVRAMESAYADANEPVQLTAKADTIREVTLVLEMIQNHFKWIYLVIMPELAKLRPEKIALTPLKGAYAASLASKALASFAGQWPHSSYMLPGGVSCDPTHLERIKAQSLVDELISFFEKECAGTALDDFLAFDSCHDFNALESDIGEIERALTAAGMHKKGFAYDRFMVLGEHRFTNPAKVMQTRLLQADEKHVKTHSAYSPSEKTFAKNACYKDEFYECGPLSRAMASNVELIKSMHRRFKDSAYSRVMARIFETARLLDHARDMLGSLALNEDSLIPPKPITGISGCGVGVVEAPRGPLIHRVEIEEGIIKSYEIVTPTQWNIGSSVKENPTPAQLAMMGNVTMEEALFIFRTFDVCSVCTTH